MVSKTLIQEVSRSFSLSLFFLPKAQRDAVTLAYLLARCGDTLTDSGPCDSEIRLADLERFENAILSESTDFVLSRQLTAYHEGDNKLLYLAPEILSDFFSLSTLQKREIKKVIQKLFGAMKWDLNVFRTASSVSPVVAVEDCEVFEWYCENIAGCVGEFWVAIFALSPSLVESAISYGKGLQRINIYRDAPEDLKLGRIYFPKSLLSRFQIDASLLWRDKNWSHLAEDYLQTTKEHLERGVYFCNAIRDSSRRLRWASYMPCAIGLKTLEKLRTDGLGARRLKVSRSEVRALAIRAVWNSFFRLPFSACASSKTSL